MKTEFRRNFGTAKWSSIVDFNGYSPFWTDVLAAGDSKRKIIFCHSDIVQEYRTRFPEFGRIIDSYRKFDQIVSVSKELCEANEMNITRIAPRVNKETNQFSYLENLIDERRLLSKEPKGAPEYLSRIKSDTRLKFCSVGRLSPEKGHRRLIEAFKDVVLNDFEAALYIVGSGPEQGSLEHYIRTNGLNDKVFLLGFMDNPFPVLSEMNCFVMPSFYEGQGLAILEALSVGLPVISTDSTGPRSILKDGYGELVENSTEGIKSGIIKFLSERPKYERFDFARYNSLVKEKCLALIF